MRAPPEHRVANFGLRHLGDIGYVHDTKQSFCWGATKLNTECLESPGHVELTSHFPALLGVQIELAGFLDGPIGTSKAFLDDTCQLSRNFIKPSPLATSQTERYFPQHIFKSSFATQPEVIQRCKRGPQKLSENGGWLVVLYAARRLLVSCGYKAQSAFMP